MVDISHERAWSEWRPFPDPTNGNRLRDLLAPAGPGVYELRRKSTGELILVGESGHCAHRMRSLVPSPPGVGRRDNSEKRDYVLRHYADIEYRTLECESKSDALAAQNSLLRSDRTYMFPT
jgi:hypothetical protein